MTVVFHDLNKHPVSRLGPVLMTLPVPPVPAPASLSNPASPRWPRPPASTGPPPRRRAPLPRPHAPHDVACKRICGSSSLVSGFKCAKLYLFGMPACCHWCLWDLWERQLFLAVSYSRVSPPLHLISSRKDHRADLYCTAQIE